MRVKLENAYSCPKMVFFGDFTPKWGGLDVIWRVDRQDRFNVATCTCDETKKEKKKERKRKTPISGKLGIRRDHHVVGSKWNFEWWWSSGVSSKIRVSSKSMKRFRSCWGSKFALSHWSVHWLIIQQLVLTVGTTVQVVTSRDSVEPSFLPHPDNRRLANLPFHTLFILRVSNDRHYLVLPTCSHCHWSDTFHTNRLTSVRCYDASSVTQDTDDIPYSCTVLWLNTHWIDRQHMPGSHQCTTVYW